MIFTDVFLALLPVSLIWSLQTRRRTRISLTVIFLVGIFATIAGIIRQLNVGPLDERDAYSIWNFAELHLAIIATSLAAVKPLFANFFDSIRTATNLVRGLSHAPRDDISMQTYRCEAGAHGAWHRGVGTSEEFILGFQNGIRVTTEVEVRETPLPPKRCFLGSEKRGDSSVEYRERQVR